MSGGTAPTVAKRATKRVENLDRKRIADLERLLAKKTLEPDFFKGALLHIEEKRRKREQPSGAPSTSTSGN